MTVALAELVDGLHRLLFCAATPICRARIQIALTLASYPFARSGSAKARW
jgi:predicted RNA polymerase sigma factor